MGLQKKFCAPLKHKKLIFSKNLTSVIWPNIEGGSHIGPGHLGTIRPQYIIQKVSTLLWPSVSKHMDRLLASKNFCQNIWYNRVCRPWHAAFIFDGNGEEFYHSMGEK